jgi:uncharacterized membrane protein YdbT with pleckstrin-like domain
MGYAEKILQPGEAVAYRARLHWIIYGGAVIAFVLALVLLVATFVAHGRPERTAFGVIGLVVLAAGAIQALGAWARQATTEILVTDRRIIVKHGLIALSTIEMNIDKVESVQVHQSVLGRMLDYGTLVVRGVGAGLEPVRCVAAPLDFHRHVNAAR